VVRRKAGAFGISNMHTLPCLFLIDQDAGRKQEKDDANSTITAFC